MKARRLGSILAIVGGATLLFIVLFPVFSQAKMCGKCVSSLSCVKRMGVGTLMYVEDHDGRLTPRDVWMDGIEPYVGNPFAFRARGMPKEAYGYAFNGALDAAKPSADAARVPMIYDSVDPIRNASDFVTSLPRPGRHKGSDDIGYADGHARRVAVP